MNYQEEVKKFFGEENQLSYAATMFYSALFEYAALIEREECAEICDPYTGYDAKHISKAIRNKA